MKSVSYSLLFLTLAATQLPAATYLYATPVGATENGRPVDATAMFDIESGSLTITLDNLEFDPSSLDQALAFLTFNLNTSAGLTNIAYSSSAEEVTVHGNAPSDYSVMGISNPPPAPWSQFASAGPVVTIGLCDNPNGIPGCAGGSAAWPSYLLLGGPNPTTNAYAKANGGVRNSAHNTYLFKEATFSITASGLPSDSPVNPISNVIFGFGTGGNENVVGVTETPEPAPFLMLISGLALVACCRRKR